MGKRERTQFVKFRLWGVHRRKKFSISSKRITDFKLRMENLFSLTTGSREMFGRHISIEATVRGTKGIYKEVK